MIELPDGHDFAQPLLRRTDAWRHQSEAYRFSMNRDWALLAMDMGTGKTKVAIDLARNWGCRSILVVAPKSVVPVWGGEYSIHGDQSISICQLTGAGMTTKKKAEKLRQFTLLNKDKSYVVVVNYEALWRGDLGKAVLGRRWGCVILDESHRIKSDKSKVSKFCARLGTTTDRRLCLTGTPMPHSPLDLFGQFRFMDPSVFGNNYHRFRFQYAILAQLPGAPKGAARVVGFRNRDELADTVAKNSYRVKAGDVLDLPDVRHQALLCEMGTKGRKIYDQLDISLRADLDNGEVTAANAMVRIIRLQQATSGHARNNDTEELQEIDTAKLDALSDLIDGLPPEERLVVFCKFRHDLAAVRRVADKLDRRSGEVSGSHRDLTDTGQYPEGVSVLAVQLQSGGLGVNLTKARYAVYYSTGCLTPGDYDQTLARLHRPGQKQKVIYYHLVAKNTIDGLVYKALKERRSIVNSVLEGGRTR